MTRRKVKERLSQSIRASMKLNQFVQIDMNNKKKNKEPTVAGKIKYSTMLLVVFLNINVFHKENT